MRRVVITGLGIVSCLGNDKETVSANLRAGRPGIRFNPEYAEKGLRSHVVSWFATQGEQGLNGKLVSNMYGHIKGVAADADPSEWPAPMPGTYWPPDLAAELNDRRILPADIHGDIISLFVPDGPKVDQQRDRRLQRLAEKLAEAYSVQAAACHLMQSDPEWDFMAVYFRAIDEICHMFMHYHPPKMAGICRATSVTTGMSALRTTCLTTTTLSARPLLRAVVT